MYFQLNIIIYNFNFIRLIYVNLCLKIIHYRYILMYINYLIYYQSNINIFLIREILNIKLKKESLDKMFFYLT